MDNSRALHDELKHIVEESGVLPKEQVESYAFDGCVPKAVVLPGSVREIQDVLRFAAKQNLSVMPAGAARNLAWGIYHKRWMWYSRQHDSIASSNMNRRI